MKDKEFLQWVHDRLVTVHNESPNIDYMLRFREIIKDRYNQDFCSEENEAKRRNRFKVFTKLNPERINNVIKNNPEPEEPEPGKTKTWRDEADKNFDYDSPWNTR